MGKNQLVLTVRNYLVTANIGEVWKRFFSLEYVHGKIVHLNNPVTLVLKN